MGDLAQLALQRIEGGLPQFPGATPAEKLALGRATARASLLKYVPELRLNQAEARDVMSQVNAWVERNKGALEQAMASPESNLPRWLVLNMGSSEHVQQWVIANYATASMGMGPWQSGKIDQLVADPASNISPNWAAVDAESRLQAFGLIVKMDSDGDLDYIFRGPPGAAQAGLGVAPVIVWAVVVAVVALAAVICTYFFLSKRLQQNNQLMRDICIKAQQEGDRATIEKCLEATRDIQLVDPLSKITGEIGKIALILGTGYIGFRFVIPWLLERAAGSTKKKAAA